MIGETVVPGLNEASWPGCPWDLKPIGAGLLTRRQLFDLGRWILPFLAIGFISDHRHMFLAGSEVEALDVV